MEGICGGEEPEETDSVRCVVPKEPGLVRVDWFELPLMPHEVLLEQIRCCATRDGHPRNAKKKRKEKEAGALREEIARRVDDATEKMRWRGRWINGSMVRRFCSDSSCSSSDLRQRARRADSQPEVERVGRRTAEREAEPREEKGQERWKERKKDERRR